MSKYKIKESISEVYFITYFYKFIALRCGHNYVNSTQIAEKLHQIEENLMKTTLKSLTILIGPALKYTKAIC